MKKFKEFSEELSACVGSGSIAGAGVGKDGEPGVSPNLQSPVLMKIKRKLIGKSRDTEEVLNRADRESSSV